MGDSMKKNLKTILLASAAALATGNAMAEGVKVIANAGLGADSVSVAEIRNVFLEVKTSLGGTHVEPVLERGGPAHETFLRHYLGRSDSDLQTYYRSLVFTGRGAMPKALDSDAEVIAYVARTRGAIGYVDSDSNAKGVRTLAVIGEGNVSERKLVSRVEPDYPEVLRSRAIGGTVRLRVTIAPGGNVTGVELLGGDAALGEAAAAAVAKWKYAAAPSRTTAEVSITFNPNQ